MPPLLSHQGRCVTTALMQGIVMHLDLRADAPPVVLTAHVRDDGARPTVVVRGEMDLNTAGVLSAGLDLVRERASAIDLDLGGVTSTGQRRFIRWSTASASSSPPDAVAVRRRRLVRSQAVGGSVRGSGGLDREEEVDAGASEHPSHGIGGVALHHRLAMTTTRLGTR